MSLVDYAAISLICMCLMVMITITWLYWDLWRPVAAFVLGGLILVGVAALVSASYVAYTGKQQKADMRNRAAGPLTFGGSDAR